jgi:hypothetical protein
MTWQSIVFLVGSIGLAALMLPTLQDKRSSVPRITSIPTGIVLGAYGVTFITMDYWLSSIGSFSGFAVWMFIAMYRHPNRPAVQEGA